MKRISTNGSCVFGSTRTGPSNREIAEGINEVMDYLEHMHAKNGKLFTCVNCRHATGYIGDLGKCCDNPLYEVSD